MKPYSEFDWAVVIPVANEESGWQPFESALVKMLDLLQSGRVYFIVDNASKDKTRELCESIAEKDTRFTSIWAPENKNIVDAYIRGFREAYESGHQFILEMDAGLSHDPRAIPMFLRVLIEGNECAFGSRYINGGSMVDSPANRRFLSKGGSILARILLGVGMKDMTSGFEGYHRSVVERLLDYPFRSQAHFFQTEMRYLLRNARWMEVPIHYRAPSPRVSKKAVRNAFVTLFHYTGKRFSGSAPNL